MRDWKQRELLADQRDDEVEYDLKQHPQRDWRFRHAPELRRNPEHS
jgi:hypothetical protein